MNSHRRLLILSCSQRKHPSQEPLPAIERYNGPLFFVLRRFLRECPLKAKQLDVYILSAAYGLISKDHQTKLYDQKMNLMRVAEIQSDVKSSFLNVIQNNYISVCFVLGRMYLKVFEELGNIIPIHIEKIVTYGTIGKKQTQLKNWLWG